MTEVITVPVTSAIYIPQIEEITQENGEISGAAFKLDTHFRAACRDASQFRTASADLSADRSSGPIKQYLAVAGDRVEANSVPIAGRKHTSVSLVTYGPDWCVGRLHFPYGGRHVV